MTFIAHVADHHVTELVYRHLPSWHAVGCYFAWREHYAAKQRAAEGIGRRRRDGSVLTEQGWLLPRGALNPRILEEPGTALMSPREVAEQERIDAEMRWQQGEHETAVLHEDLAVFGMQWRAVVEVRPSAYLELMRCSGRSEEREAFMARWHAENAPH
jgi:hypothetical protein